MAFDGRATDKRRIQDSDGSNLSINNMGSIFSDSGEHNRTAKDSRFFYQHYWSSVTAGSTVTITISTNSKYPHGLFHFNCDNNYEYSVTLSSTTDTSLINGTQDYQFNINRGKNEVRSVASFYYDDTSVSTIGLLHKTIEQGKTTAGRFASVDPSVGVDWLLDKERIYNITITNNGDDAGWIMFRYFYHEHAPTFEPDVSGDGEDETEYDGELIV